MQNYTPDNDPLTLIAGRLEQITAHVRSTLHLGLLLDLALEEWPDAKTWLRENGRGDCIPDLQARIDRMRKQPQTERPNFAAMEEARLLILDLNREAASIANVAAKSPSDKEFDKALKPIVAASNFRVWCDVAKLEPTTMDDTALENAKKQYNAMFPNADLDFDRTHIGKKRNERADALRMIREMARETSNPYQVAADNPFTPPHILDGYAREVEILAKYCGQHLPHLLLTYVETDRTPWHKQSHFDWDGANAECMRIVKCVDGQLDATIIEQVDVAEPRKTLVAAHSKPPQSAPIMNIYGSVHMGDQTINATDISRSILASVATAGRDNDISQKPEDVASAEKPRFFLGRIWRVIVEKTNHPVLGAIVVVVIGYFAWKYLRFSFSDSQFHNGTKP